MEFTPDSLQLGGKLCLVNGVVYPDFSIPSLAPAGSQNPSLPSRKRISPANVSSTSAKSVTSTNPKVCVIQASGHPPASVPIPPASEREAPQNQRVHFESSNDDLQVSSQPEPEVTSVEPPSRVRKNVWDRINSLDGISVSVVNASVERAADSPDIASDDVTESSNSDLIARIEDTISKYRHHWADN